MTASTLTRPLPLEIEEITLDWLTSAIHTRHPDAVLSGFEIEKIDNGTCTKIYVKLDLDDASRAAGMATQVIVKGGFEAHSRAMPYMHLAEVRSYRDVLPALGLPSPACYFADFDEASGQGIVIMENLRARGVELCHPLKPHTPEQVARRLAELARYHAKTWNSADLLPGGRWAELPGMLDGDHLQMFLEPEPWTRFVNMPRGRAASVYFHDGQWMADALDRLRKLAQRLPNAVLHGDTHLGNLYVEPDGTPGFFDSLPHQWSPIGEITYHIGCALDPMDRRRCEGDLVRGYLNELTKLGIEAPNYEDTMQHYAAFLAFGFCIFMVNDAGWQPEAINTAYTARFSAAMVDNDTLGALAALD